MALLMLSRSLGAGAEETTRRPKSRCRRATTENASSSPSSLLGWGHWSGRCVLDSGSLLDRPTGAILHGDAIASAPDVRGRRRMVTLEPHDYIHVCNTLLLRSCPSPAPARIACLLPMSLHPRDVVNASNKHDCLPWGNANM